MNILSNINTIITRVLVGLVCLSVGLGVLLAVMTLVIRITEFDNYFFAGAIVGSFIGALLLAFLIGNEIMDVWRRTRE